MDITGLTVFLWTLLSFPYSKVKVIWILNQTNNATELKKHITSDGNERSVPKKMVPFVSNEYMVLIYLRFY